jgi:hypothetical protein
VDKVGLRESRLREEVYGGVGVMGRTFDDDGVVVVVVVGGGGDRISG